MAFWKTNIKTIDVVEPRFAPQTFCWHRGFTPHLQGFGHLTCHFPSPQRCESRIWHRRGLRAGKGQHVGETSDGSYGSNNETNKGGFCENSFYNFAHIRLCFITKLTTHLSNKTNNSNPQQKSNRQPLMFFCRFRRASNPSQRIFWKRSTCIDQLDSSYRRRFMYVEMHIAKRRNFV